LLILIRERLLIMIPSFEPVEYREEFRPALIDFPEKCLPESGRALDINGRHSFYLDIRHGFSRFMCMFDGIEMIGTAAVRVIDSTSCELKSLYLLERYHGKGFGRQLLDEAVSCARKLGCRRMFLDTLSTSHRAIALYLRAGFVPAEKYNQAERSDVFMVLELNRSADN